MKRKNSRRKGAVAERDLSEYLRERGYPAARRGQQRSGLDQSDVIGGPEQLHIECKHVERLNVWEAHQQAARDAPAGKTPVVVMKRNRSPWLIVMPLDAFLELLPVDPDPLAGLPRAEVGSADEPGTTRPNPT